MKKELEKIMREEEEVWIFVKGKDRWIYCKIIEVNLEVVKIKHQTFCSSKQEYTVWEKTCWIKDIEMIDRVVGVIPAEVKRLIKQ